MKFTSHVRKTVFICNKYYTVVLVIDNSVVVLDDISAQLYNAIDRINKLYPPKKQKKLTVGNVVRLLYDFFLEEYACELTLEISDRDNHHLRYGNE